MNSKEWTYNAVNQLYEMPYMDLVVQAHTIHRQAFDPNRIQISALLSIKTGACPEDCKYCPQSAHYQTGLEPEKLMSVEHVVSAAKRAKANGASRFCMGAAWRQLPDRKMPELLEMIRAVKKLGLETCVTLGMIRCEQAKELKAAGLDFYNHNLDTSADYYPNVVSTRCYQERLDTLEAVQQANISVCCGGILGMGETRKDRIYFLLQLAKLSEPPKSIPINQLIPIPGTPFEDLPPIDSFEFIRTIAVTRILFPIAYIRLSAGRENMSQEMQAWCFFSGANSIFSGEQLLTAANQAPTEDREMFEKLGLTIENIDHTEVRSE